MKKIGFEISLEMHMARLEAAIDARGLTPAEEARFNQEWHDLEASGAVMQEFRLMGDRVVAYPSEDFTLHCAKWGIHP
jgi:hypothetical protein